MSRSALRGRIYGSDNGFKTMDGCVDFVIRVEENWAEPCRRIGVTHILGDPRFSSWWKCADNLAELRQALTSAMHQKTNVEVLHIIDELDALCAPMHDYETLLRDPQVQEDRMLLELQTSEAPFPNNRSALEIQHYAGNRKAGTTPVQPQMSARS